MTLTAMILVGIWLLIFGYILGHMGGRETRKEAQKRGWTVLETLANGHNRQACRMIGAALEIESDGEDVGEYVEWACREAYIANEKASLECQIAYLDKRRTSP